MISGVYMLYVDDFNDDSIIPFYIGKSKDIQRRFFEHMKQLMALNRFTNEIYSEYLLGLFYTGVYKTCKIFKYMVDHQCTLKNIHMVVLENCDENELLQLESKYIRELKAEYFGFNQLISVNMCICQLKSIPMAHF